MKYPDPSDSSKTKEAVLWENGATQTARNTWIANDTSSDHYGFRSDGKVTISGEDNYAAEYTVPASGEFAGCYRISNVKMYELPSTGGPGDYLFTIIGIAISTVVILLKLRERNEKRAA